MFESSPSADVISQQHGYLELKMKDSSSSSSTVRATRTPPRPSPSRSARLSMINCEKSNTISSCGVAAAPAASSPPPPSCSTAAATSAYQLHSTTGNTVTINQSNTRKNIVEIPSTRRPSGGSPPSSSSPSITSPHHHQQPQTIHHHLHNNKYTAAAASTAHSSSPIHHQHYSYATSPQLPSPSSAVVGVATKVSAASSATGTPPASDSGRSGSPNHYHHSYSKCRGSSGGSTCCSSPSGGGSTLGWLQQHNAGGGATTAASTFLNPQKTANNHQQHSHNNCGNSLQEQHQQCSQSQNRSQPQQNHLEPWFSGLVSKYFYATHSQQQQQQQPPPPPPPPYSDDNNKLEGICVAENCKGKCEGVDGISHGLDDHDHSSVYDNSSSFPALYKGPDPTPNVNYKRLYDPVGPIMFSHPPLKGLQHSRAELRLWHSEEERVISQNSSKRKVHRAHWLSPVDPQTSFPVAMKFVEDFNTRDGRSIKREIECHLYIHQRLGQLMQDEKYKRVEDAWPCAEMFGYHLDKKHPGKSVLVTRKLSGPDFFDVIRTEHSAIFNNRSLGMYEFHKLQWCYLAMERIAQYGRLGIRHNDIKPDNIVLDFYSTPDSSERQLDVKLIDLGTASMQHAKDFTGGTSWYESPEQKLLEFHTKKQRNPEAAKQVEISLESDVWGAGLSITEVLMGRRVVDSMKGPEGPGSLEYRGAIDGWAVDPAEWVRAARQPLGLDRESQKFPLCAEAARQVFDALVVPHPNDRMQILDFLPKLKHLVDEAMNSVKRKYGTSNSSHGGNNKISLHAGNNFTSNPPHVHSQHPSYGLS